MSQAGFNAGDEAICVTDIMEILNLCLTFEKAPGYCHSYGTDSLKQTA